MIKSVFIDLLQMLRKGCMAVVLLVMVTLLPPGEARRRPRRHNNCLCPPAGRYLRLGDLVNQVNLSSAVRDVRSLRDGIDYLDHTELGYRIADNRSAMVSKNTSDPRTGVLVGRCEKPGGMWQVLVTIVLTLLAALSTPVGLKLIRKKILYRNEGVYLPARSSDIECRLDNQSPTPHQTILTSVVGEK